VKRSIQADYPVDAAATLLQETDEIYGSFQNSILLNSILSKSFAPATEADAGGAL